MDNYLRYVINVRDVTTGDLESQIQVTQQEANMPGYVEHLLKGYWGTRWMTDLVEVVVE